MSTILPTSTFNTGGVPALSRRDPGDGPALDQLSDAEGFLATVAKNQAVFFEELIVEDECLAEVEGDTVFISMPRVTFKLPLHEAKYADQIAKWAADKWFTFAKACFEDLRS